MLLNSFLCLVSDAMLITQVICHKTSFIQTLNYLEKICNISLYYKFSILSIILEGMFVKLSLYVDKMLITLYFS